MFNSKYSKFLTVILVIVIIGIIALLGFLGYDYYNKYFTENDNRKFVDDFENQISTSEENNTTTEGNAVNPLDSIESTPTASTGKRPQYKGFDTSGTIYIPKTNAKYAVITKMSKKAIETAVAIQYGGPELNQPGNTVIAGHNYRNGLFFSNNKKLDIGDVIYITDNSGTKLKYTIYNKYETSEHDTDYMTRDTQGAKEISLTTCTDNSKARLIIWAKADE